MRKSLKLTVLALAGLLMASPAMAVTLNYSLVNLTPGPQPVPDLATSTPVTFNNVAGGLTDVYRDVWENTACADTCPFNSVSAGGEASYLMPGNLTTLSMMWGSPDKSPPAGWNLIEFWQGGVLVDSVLGDVIAAAYQGLGGIPGTGFITVLFSNIGDDGNGFDQIILKASQNAFEHAFDTGGFDVTPQVPLPAGLVLLLSGLMGLGFLSRSRVKAT